MSPAARSGAGHRAATGGEGADRGSATVELAVSLPALVVLLMVSLWAVTAVRIRAECVDAAREAALAAARGADGSAAGARVAPPGAVVTVAVGPAMTTATVTASVNPAGAHLAAFTVTATAVAAVEPGQP